MRLFNFMIPNDLDKAIKAESERTGVPMSEIARRGLISYLRNQQIDTSPKKKRRSQSRDGERIDIMGFTTKAVGGSTGADRAEIRRALEILIDPDHAYEVQALPSGKWWHLEGKDLDGGVQAAWEMSEERGVYWMLNPFPVGLGRPPRFKDILSRRWLLIDVDPIRPKGEKDVNATDEEKAECGKVTCEILTHLEDLGWPRPVMVDSGNGWHLLFRIDLPNTDLARILLKDVLAWLGDKFDSDKAKVDRAVHNANRISKLPGTWARKGPEEPSRPHRMAHLLVAPNPVEIVTTEQLEALIRKEEKPLPKQPLEGSGFAPPQQMDLWSLMSEKPSQPNAMGSPTRSRGRRKGGTIG